MLNLKQDFPHITEYRLEQNYRSTQSILDAATKVISQTNDYPVLKLWTENRASEPMIVLETETGDDEAHQIIQEIFKQRRLYDLRDIAILYRTNAQSRPFEEALVKAGLPYRLVGGFKFYERKEIKDLLAYLRLVVNPTDTVSQERALKLGKRRYTSFSDWRNTLPPYSLENATTDYQPLNLLREILKATNYLDLFDKNDPEDFSRLENIQELENVAAQFYDTKVFLENVALVQDDYLADLEDKNSADVITLMSLHSAKGLEYPVIFMVGMEDGLLPHSRSLMDRAQMEEERRLCYVGITRAKEKLYFSYARVRWLFGTPTYGLRSRFLRDIPSELLEERSSAGDFSETGFSQSRRGQLPYNPAYPGRRPYFPKQKPTNAVKSTSGRRLIIDDDMLDGVLTGDIDIKSFLEN